MIRITFEKIRNWYKALIIVFLVLDYSILYLNLLPLGNFKFLDILRLTVVVLFAVMYLCRIILSKCSFSTWLRTSLILIITLLAWALHLNILVKTMLLSIAMSLLPPQEIFKIVGLSATITVIIGTITSLLGVTPLFGADRTIVLGFVHKNTAGLFLFLSVSYFLYISTNKKIKNAIAYIFSILVFFIDWYLISDRTVAIVILLLLVIKIVYFKRQKASKVWLLLPILLLVLSLFVSWRYNGASYYWYIFDNILSYRPRIWRYVWQRKSISLFPQDLTFTDVDFGVVKFWGNLPLDGFFSLGILVYGMVYFTLLMIFLIYLLWNLVSKKELFELFPYAVCVIMVGFSELTAVAYTTSWLLPVAVCIYIGFYTKKATLNLVDNF